ncbi:hypothetical protein ACA910_016028 [Epithemia clementina (nom. ined.)]
MSSRRLSLGGSVLRDASNSSSRRRLSSGAPQRTETPQKDRREALEEWRRNSRARDGVLEQENDANDAKRARMQAEGPPLPPSSQKFVEKEMTALERYRMKKQLKQQQQQDQSCLPPRVLTAVSSKSLSDEVDDEMTCNAGSLMSTPSSRRRLSSSRARRRSYVPRPNEEENPYQQNQQANDQEQLSFSFAQNSETPSRPQRPPTITRPEHDHLNGPHGQHTAEPKSVQCQESTGGSVEAGLRSRLREMEHRIEQLEKDKMDLLVAKAPLETRIQEKEQEWATKEKRLLNEIESLKQNGRERDNQFRDLQAIHEATHEELKRFRLEAKKPANPGANRGAVESSKWGRLYQNNGEEDELKKQLKNALDDNEYLRGEKVSLEKELHGTKIEFQALSRALDELQTEYDSLTNYNTENRDAEIKLEHLTTEHIATSAQLNAVCQDLADTKARAEAEATTKEEAYKKSLEELRFQLSVATTRAATVGAQGEQGNEGMAVLQARNEEQARRIAELEADVRRGEELRRQMHNRIQELRGNIRVFVRTRPFLPGDGEQKDPAIEVSPDGESLTIEDIRTSKTHNFSFDKVFPPSAGQDQVFNEVADFVQSALDGYHVCLFSYGQTGSGKTHTMQGSGHTAMRGIIPRAVEQILNQARVLQTQKWDFKVCASFLEIYNEELKDLLVGNSHHEQVKLSIKRNKSGKSYVDGLSESTIDTNDISLGMEQLTAIMTVAARARSVASTKMNEQSSRSHSVFMLHLRGYNEETGAEVHGALNLCDLAGSERLDRSEVGSDAQRLRETQAINKSLSCLGDVFNALAQGASHVPYRNSKLTYLLQDCLSGDGKALMFVNLSPTPASSNESLCSLRFAQRVNQVELGKPTKNIQYKKQ